MTQARYPLDFSPWQPGRIAGFVGTWLPFTASELEAAATADTAILKAAADSATEHALRKGGRNG